MISPRQPNFIFSKLLKSPANKIHQCRKLYVPNLSQKRKLPKNSSTELLLSDRKVKRKERTVKSPRKNFSKFQNHRAHNSGGKGYKSYRSLKNEEDNINKLIFQNNELKNNNKIDKSLHCRVIVTDCNQEIQHYIAIDETNQYNKELTLNFMKNTLKGQGKNKIVEYLDKLYPNVYYKNQPSNISLDFILLDNKISNDFLKGRTIRLKTQKKIDISKEKISLKHFEIIKLIGSGGFSKVFLCRFKEDGKFYALKLIDKEVIVKNKKKRIIMNQRNIMEQSSHPFLIDMKFAFQTQKYLAFVLEYCPGGELFGLVKKYKTIPEKTARFYIIEILLGLEYLHQNHIVYRDIKPQNILLTVQGHVKIADLGLAKPNMDRQVAYSFCGSPEYMSPEMILQVGHSYPVDHYCMGALLYELLTGLPPFYSRDPNEIYEAVLSQEVYFPDDIPLTADCRSLLRGLLCKDYKKRLGSLHGIRQILSHPWFGKNSYNKYLEKQIVPPTDFLDYQKLSLDHQTKETAEIQLKAVLSEQRKQKYSSEHLKPVMKNFYYDCRSKNAYRQSGQLNSQRSNGSNKENQLKPSRSNSNKKSWKRLTGICSGNKAAQNTGKVGKRIINHSTSRL